MRLSKIRLSGFKSFVDTTPVALGSGITAIVGPNGCGKSNIIDAVRWVMGERSAKHLRGGSMADVIFSGSGSRKPVGQASIELVFDNADGSLGGQYAGFSEIAIRRQVNRDGQSAYFLNGSRCRRRDITDVFLGTGLGPRSYSIIEQGTISRLIEARPEALRGYLEEAAGISLYKERRRETERRIRDTRENLERLDDMRAEVARQLDRLNDQARTAERYRQLKADERQCHAELTLLRIRQLEAEQADLQTQRADAETALEARLAEQRRCERGMESVRAEQTAASDHLNAVQAEYYELGSTLAALEQRIRHDQETLSQSRQALEQTRAAIAENDRALSDDRDERQTLTATIDTETPALAAADQALAEAEQTVATAGARLDEAREQRDAVGQEHAEAERRMQLEQTRIDQLEARVADQDRRLARIAEELDLQAGEDASADATDRADIEALVADREPLDARIAAADTQLAAAAEERQSLDARIDEQRSRLNACEARRESLQTLQDEALGRHDEMARWLQAQGLEGHRRLGDQLAVAPGWEMAVEWALERALEAVEAGDADPDTPQAGEVMLFSAVPGADAPPDSLAAKVAGPAAVTDLLARIRTADSRAEARGWLSRLAPGESVMTADGAWYGHGWRRLRATATDPEAGVVARGRAIEAVTAEIAGARHALDDLMSRREATDARSADAKADRQRAVEARQSLDQALAAARARQQAAIDQQRAKAEQRQRLMRERTELTESRDEARAAIDRAVAERDAARVQVQSARDRRIPLDEALDTARAGLERARAAAAAARDQRQAVALRLERAETARQSRDQAIARLAAQASELQQRADELQATIDALGDPDATRANERQSLLSRRAERESALEAARRRLDDQAAMLRQLDTERSLAEQAVRERRETRDGLRHREVEVEARLADRREQFAALPVDGEAIAGALPEDADESAYIGELERLAAAIDALGAINLAAIDEQATLAERKTYLDDQQADLSAALETLENAIQRIDRETRSRFRATFDEVNAGLQRLFPTLFGGGEAYLEMTEANLLETGVTLMARPPGKRISNIHLLSGGEKALAAVALVFAIFELNPAPFCMLDEVDAPLDEANVGRFCDLLRSLSDRVQFIVITHNKATMEAASHLAGVTMAEPGVSRLVAVDVEAAVEMTAGET
ncbi:chromosome segregation protein SMC [Spiribacter roseus]|uniref:chromosome segregation protein SMC n=1 Tax=Spiribacter roseus TaxID=1855875 RepID=UPI000F6B9927|nr:chromosome segregation protein SMC [Spiribacter roseus]